MQPLSGLKILDFSTLLPGPYATMLMADMGADVLRVESPSRPDLVREMPPKVAGQSAAFQYLNRGKRSIGLNLKHALALEIINELVKTFDIVVEQFRPGVMARLGLGYEQLKEVNPRLIYCSITGYGQSGPYRDRAGHDINYLALSGISGSSGRQNELALNSVQIADVAAGSQPAVIAILAAVIQRQSTGEGQYIDIAMSDQCLALQPLMMPGVLNGEPSVSPEGHFLNGSGLYDYYETADGRHMAVGSLEPQFRQQLVDVIGHPEWFDKSDAEIKSAIKAVFMSQPQNYWIDKFSQVDACVEPVLTMAEAAEMPHARQRRMVVDIEGGKQVRPAPLLKGMSADLLSKAPLCGEDTQDVLKTLGYSQKEVDAFTQEGVFS